MVKPGIEPRKNQSVNEGKKVSIRVPKRNEPTYVIEEWRQTLRNLHGWHVWSRFPCQIRRRKRPGTLYTLIRAIARWLACTMAVWLDKKNIHQRSNSVHVQLHNSPEIDAPHHQL